jgi:hypothetical protein
MILYLLIQHFLFNNNNLNEFLFLTTCFSFVLNDISIYGSSYNDVIFFENYLYNSTSEVVNSFFLLINSELIITSFVLKTNNKSILQFLEYPYLLIFTFITILYLLLTIEYFFIKASYIRYF